MSDITYPLFPIFAFLGFILPLIPLPWHLQALNSGTCFFILWSSLACLNQFVNSIVWAGNTLNPSPAWCEISIRIMMGASVGIPAASLCINRRLYYIASSRTASVSFAEKRRAVLVDSLICILFPLIYIALQYIVQGHRFNIVEDIGCYPALFNTLPTFFISSMWPVVLGLISAVYCVLSLRCFARRRAEFSQFLSSNTSLTMGRYFRLMGLSMTELCATTPLAVFIMWVNATATPVSPWRGWDDAHFDFSRVDQIPAVFWRNDHFLAVAIEFSRWVVPLCSFTFFAFFGFAQESMRHYRLAWNWLKNLFGVPPPKSGHFVKTAQYQSQGTAKQAISPNVPTFTLPLHDLKRAPSTTSTNTNLTKLSYLDSYPSTPQSSTVISNLPPSYFQPTNKASSAEKIPLSRSRTL